MLFFYLNEMKTKDFQITWANILFTMQHGDGMGRLHVLERTINAERYIKVLEQGSSMCQENTPHTITPPPAAWTVETRQDGSMLSCSLRQILTLTSECFSRNRDSSDQATFLQSSIVQFCWACVNCSLRFLFLADRSGTGVVFCCWSPSASGFDVLCVQSCILHTLVVMSGYLSYCCLSIICNQSAHSPLTSTRHFHPHNCRSLDIFSFSDHSL